MKPATLLLHLVCAFLPAAVAPLSAGTSASYTIVPEIRDLGGLRAVSASYTNDGSAGFAGFATAAPNETSRNGYAGQLYEIIGFVLDANPTTIDENGTRQLEAALLLDDASKLALPPSSVAWAVESGPLVSVDGNGLATAGVVYQNTNASVRGTYAGDLSTLLLTVLNINPDDLPGYAGDGIDDDWQVQYFGQPPNPDAGPNVDFDGTGQTNFFKFVAGLNPLDPRSRFTLAIAPIPGQPTRKSLIFAPLVAGRTYNVMFSTDLQAPLWGPLPSSTFLDQGAIRTVTDLNATGAKKVYRVEISKP